MTTGLDRYGFAQAVVDAVAPVIEALKTQGVSAARRALASSTIQWCEEIESKTLEPREADSYFTLLDLYLGEHGGEAQLGDDTQRILVEGMTLHHLGESVGTDLSTLRRLATEILGTDCE